jgi:hypothetical protein
MTQQHPITPPPELVAQWWRKQQIGDDFSSYANEFATFFARWGADTELEACCSQLAYWGVHGYNKLYEARRPKPPSLKEQALQALAELAAECYGNTDQSDTIRRALEKLDD